MDDIFAKCERFLQSPRALSPGDLALASELFSSVSPPRNAGPWIEMDGVQVLQFSSNDYLGLAMHPDVLARVVEVATSFGICSPMGSRAMTGTTQDHLTLDRKVALFKRCESALTFTTGSLAMIGSLACLATSNDVLLLDTYAHASLNCGARISGATLVFFRHNDPAHLDSLLKRHARGKPTAIVIDGVYSMQGDLAPLDEIVEVKRKHGVRLIVDDAHGTGVFGPGGRGTAAHFGLEHEVDLHLGTFSKAVGTLGGFAAGDRETIEFLRFNAPTHLFTKSMPLACAAATLKSLELLQQGEQRRETLWSNTRRLQDGLRAAGFDIGETQSPITPIQFEGNDALRVARELRQSHRIWAAPVIYPAVEMGKSILRVIPTANHTEEHINLLIDSLSQVRSAVS